MNYYDIRNLAWINSSIWNESFNFSSFRIQSFFISHFHSSCFIFGSDWMMVCLKFRQIPVILLPSSISGWFGVLLVTFSRSWFPSLIFMINDIGDKTVKYVTNNSTCHHWWLTNMNFCVNKLKTIPVIRIAFFSKILEIKFPRGRQNIHKSALLRYQRYMRIWLRWVFICQPIRN